jgi:hypothetical protein
MNSTDLFSLIPAPLPIKTDALSGTLSIEGDFVRNVIRFRFRFSDPLAAAPVLLAIRAGGKNYRCYCAIRDETEPIMETPVFHPEFSVGQQLIVTAVEPLVRFIKSQKICPDSEKTPRSLTNNK